MKKITIDKKEEIELTEREEKIYKTGQKDGMAETVLVVLLVMGIILILLTLFI